jgi:hypothetical protein
MKKVFKIVGVVVLLLLITIISLPFIFKDKLIELVKVEANKNLNAKVDFGEFDLSIFSTFPNFMFTINDVKVEGVDKFEGITLAKIGTFETTLDIQSVIDGEQIKIISFQIIDLDVHAIVLKDSTANWDIAKASETVENEIETPDTAETKFNIALKKYAIKNANIIYDDAVGNMHAEVLGFSHEGDGDFTQDVFTLNTQTIIEVLNFKMDGINYAKKMNIDFKVDMEIDNLNEKYTFKENSFRMNQLVLGLNGWLAFKGDDMDMDVSFDAQKIEFKHLLSLVPAVYLTDFNDIQTAGKIAFNGMAKGLMTETSLPAFALNLKVEDAMFKYPDLPKSVEDVQIAVNITNPGGSEDNTVVDIRNFHLKMGNNPVDMKLLLKTPVSDPDMDGEIKMNIDLQSMKEFIPMEEGESYNGNIAADITFKGKLSTIDNEDYENFEALGNLKITDMAYTSKDLPYEVDIDELNLEFSPRFVSLTSFKSKIGESDIDAAGRIDNFLAYTFRDENLSGTFNVNSNYMNLNELMADEESETTDSTSETSEEDGVFEVPRNINFNMTMDIKKMLYDNIEITNVKGGVAMNEGVMSLDKLMMNLMKGSVSMSGKYDTREALPLVDFMYDITKFDLQETFNTFNTVQKLAPIAENATGAFSTKLSFTAQLDEKMEVVMNSLNGKGTLQTHKVVIGGSNTIKKVANALQQPKYETLSLENANLTYAFTDGRLYLSPFDLKISNTNANIGGSHGFDETMDYKMALDIPTSEFGSQANTFVTGLLSKGGQFGVDAKMPERINVDVFITGTVNDPKISTGLKGSVASTAADIKEQVIEEVKEIVKEKVEEVIEDTKEKAREEAAKIIKQAEEQAAILRAQAQKSADLVKKEGYKQADDLEKQAKNPLEKTTAKIAADKLRKETDAKAQKIVDDADKEAKTLIETAKKQSDDLLK